MKDTTKLGKDKIVGRADIIVKTNSSCGGTEVKTDIIVERSGTGMDITING